LTDSDHPIRTVHQAFKHVNMNREAVFYFWSYTSY